MIDLFLKFTDQTEMFSVLEPLNMIYTNQNNEKFVLQSSHQYAAWEVGLINGKSGWHLNIRIIDSSFDYSTLEQYRVFPSQPACVWA